VKKFIDEVIAEMKKVSWATKKELVNYTVVVCIAVAIVCALIWFCDTIFARLFHIILR
jgi:preprotein translocase subunit SecE